MAKLTMKRAENMIKTGHARYVVWYLENRDVAGNSHRLPGAGYMTYADAAKDDRLPEFPGYKPYPFLVTVGSETVWKQGQGRAGNAYAAKVPVFGLAEIAV
jgi:hypothetical protein